MSNKMVDELGRVTDYWKSRILDDESRLTNMGYAVLEKIGVYLGENVSIQRSTVDELVELYNNHRIPQPPLDPIVEILFRGVKLPEETHKILSYVDGETDGFKTLNIRIGSNSVIGKSVEIHPVVRIGESCSIGNLSKICMASVIDNNVSVGKYVFLGIDTDIGEYSVLEDRVIVASHNIVPAFSYLEGGNVFNSNPKT